MQTSLGRLTFRERQSPEGVLHVCGLHGVPGLNEFAGFLKQLLGLGVVPLLHSDIGKHGATLDDADRHLVLPRNRQTLRECFVGLVVATQAPIAVPPVLSRHPNPKFETDAIAQLPRLIEHEERRSAPSHLAEYPTGPRQTVRDGPVVADLVGPVDRLFSELECLLVITTDLQLPCNRLERMNLAEAVSSVAVRVCNSPTRFDPVLDAAVLEVFKRFLPLGRGRRLRGALSLVFGLAVLVGLLACQEDKAQRREREEHRRTHWIQSTRAAGQNPTQPSPHLVPANHV